MFLQEQGITYKSIGAVFLIGQHFLEFLRLRDMYFLLSTTSCGLALLAVRSEPLERLHYHTSCPGLCINTADLFPFQALHQMIRSTVSVPSPSQMPHPPR